MICSVKYGSDWVTGLFIAGVKSLNLSSSLAHNNLIVIKSSWVIRAPSTNCLTWKNGQMFHSSTFRMGRVVESTYCIQYVHYLILTMRPLTVFSLTAKFQASLPSMWLYSYNTITSSHPMPGLISAPWIRSSTDAVRKPQPQSRYNVREYVLQAGIAAVCGCGSSLSLTVALAH